MTFGPVGRLVATVIVFLPILYAVFVSVFFVIAAALWALFLLPMALRDIWRSAHNGREPPPSIALGPEPTAPGPGESILDRPAPRRW